MGAWGTSVFDNDTSMDWLGSLVESDDPGRIGSTLATVADAGPDDYLDADACNEALAAAEIIAAANGRPCPQLDSESDRGDAEAIAWLEREQPVFGPEVVVSAHHAITRVLTDSELKELWAEQDDSPGWNAMCEDLQQRVVVSAA